MATTYTTVKKIKEYFNRFSDDLIVHFNIIILDESDPDSFQDGYGLSFDGYADSLSTNEEGKNVDAIGLTFQFDKHAMTPMYKMYEENINKYSKYFDKKNIEYVPTDL